MTLHPHNNGTLTDDEIAAQLSAAGYVRHVNGTTWLSPSLVAAATAKLKATRYDLSALTPNERAALTLPLP